MKKKASRDMKLCQLVNLLFVHEYSRKGGNEDLNK